MSLAVVLVNAKNNELIAEYLNTTINLCKFSKGLIGNFLIQIIYQDVLKYSNYTYACPLKKVSATKDFSWDISYNLTVL